MENCPLVTPVASEVHEEKLTVDSTVIVCPSITGQVRFSTRVPELKAVLSWSGTEATNAAFSCSYAAGDLLGG